MNIVEIPEAVKKVIDQAVIDSKVMPIKFESYKLDDQSKDFCQIIVADNGTQKPSFGHTRLGLIRFNVYQKKNRGIHRAKTEILRFFDLFPAGGLIEGLRIPDKGKVYSSIDINKTWDMYPSTIAYEVIDNG